jgi:nanoRNase/pAp phosphatase (c-di-AMP/oligoRNAs hydrolase)
MPEMPVGQVKQLLMELRKLKNRVLQERALFDVQQEQLEEVKAVLLNFEPVFAKLDRQSQLEVMHRFIRRIDVGVTDIVVQWRFSETDCVVGRSEVSPKARKKGGGGRVVEIGANGQSCDSSTSLLFKLVLEAVAGVAIR